MTLRPQLLLCTLAQLSLLLGGPSCRHDQHGSLKRSRWQPASTLQRGLPDAIRVFELTRDDLPLRAWYARIDPSSPDVEVRVLGAHDEDALSTVSEFAEECGALLAVNAGYFGVRSGIGNPHGLLLEEHEVLKPSWRQLKRDDETYPVARAALGVTEDGAVDIAWVTGGRNGLYEWLDPWSNVPGVPCTPPPSSASRPWPVEYAVQGGPNLLREGRVLITEKEEVINDRISDRHPRTAAGVTANGELILMVVDGRRAHSRGVDLEELALLLKGVGCVEALNLDGGGSSALVVGGRLVNKPGGSGVEREVASAVVIVDPRRAIGNAREE